MLKWLLLLGGGLLAWKIVDASQTSTAGDQLMTDIDGIKLDKSAGGVELLITMKHANPTNKTLKFDFMFLDFYIDNQKFAAVRQDSLGLQVPANKVSKQTIKVNLPYVGAVITIANLIAAGKIPQTVKVVGPIKVGSYVTEYNSEYPISIPYLDKWK